MGMLSALQASGYTGRALLVGRGAEVPALQLIAKKQPDLCGYAQPRLPPVGAAHSGSR